MTTRETVLRIGAAVTVVAVVAAVVGGAIFLGPRAGGTSDPTRSPSQSASRMASEDASGADSSASTPSPTPRPTPTVGPTQSTTPATSSTPSPTGSPSLPALLGAIGDSYSQAYNTSPQQLHDHPTYSWVVGSARGDGVYSFRERLQALGASLTVVDAATSGRRMNDASRQATLVVAAARKLAAGQRAFVTFELGTNDLCDDAKTSPADFKAQLDAAMSILRGGLPAGSKILMLSLPDFDHFRSITQADPQARAGLAETVNSQNCAPFLGANGPLSLNQAEAAMAEYNSILTRVCGAIQSSDGASGRLSCRTDQALLSERDFKIGDLSTVDYFHPSLSGQAKMAAAAWSAADWSAVSLSAGG